MILRTSAIDEHRRIRPKPVRRLGGMNDSSYERPNEVDDQFGPYRIEGFAPDPALEAVIMSLAPMILDPCFGMAHLMPCDGLEADVGLQELLHESYPAEILAGGLPMEAGQRDAAFTDLRVHLLLRFDGEDDGVRIETHLVAESQPDILKCPVHTVEYIILSILNITLGDLNLMRLNCIVSRRCLSIHAGISCTPLSHSSTLGV